LIAVAIDTAQAAQLAGTVVLSALFVESGSPGLAVTSLRSWRLCEPWMEQMWPQSDEVRGVSFRTQHKSTSLMEHRLSFESAPAMAYWSVELALSIGDIKEAPGRLEEVLRDLRRDVLEWTRGVRQDEKS